MFLTLSVIYVKHFSREVFLTLIIFTLNVYDVVFLTLSVFDVKCF